MQEAFYDRSVFKATFHSLVITKTQSGLFNCVTKTEILFKRKT